jgi:hypothetical protein
MVLDPKWFDSSPYAPWPKVGAHVVCQKKDGKRFVGTVTLVWAAMDAICIDVLAQGVKERIFREFGDTCKEV